jgi:uncharacterized membrane protein
VLVFIGALASAKSTDVKFGFGGFIGPIPFGFANDPRILIALIVLMIAIILLTLVLR